MVNGISTGARGSAAFGALGAVPGVIGWTPAFDWIAVVDRILGASCPQHHPVERTFPDARRNRPAESGTDDVDHAHDSATIPGSTARSQLDRAVAGPPEHLGRGSRSSTVLRSGCSRSSTGSPRWRVRPGEYSPQELPDRHLEARTGAGATAVPARQQG
ncbi:hypothetical protein UA75_17055 [Actinoalloteichus sp. GBA129-24]|nr:hypothetical protein UA75_17055 [Actinoalloteichus sp. GBA129-24]